MAEAQVINVDLADVWAETSRKTLLRTLSWGDEVAVTRRTNTSIEIELKQFIEAEDGSITPRLVKGHIVPREFWREDWRGPGTEEREQSSQGELRRCAAG